MPTAHDSNAQAPDVSPDVRRAEALLKILGPFLSFDPSARPWTSANAKYEPRGANADEALRLFEQHPTIDLHLTDVVMPGASGPELTKRLVEERRTLRVIYMSGYTEEAIVQHGVLKPGIAFLHKPFTSETLGQKIREVLER
jgi:CheY-like chemotaxis protein